MSTVTVSRGSARNSSQLHDIGRSTAPWMPNVQRSSGVRGVGPADSTGKPLVTYCPGGTRPVAAAVLRRRKLREMTIGPPSAQRPEGVAQFLGEQLRLLPRGEVAALVELAVVDE